MKQTHKNKLLLGASFLALGVLSSPSQGLAQNCNGIQNRTTQCVDSTGKIVSESYCTNNGLSKPATHQDCSYSCPPPPPVSSSSKKDKKDKKSVNIDTDGDGKADTEIEEGKSVKDKDGNTIHYKDVVDNQGNCSKGKKCADRIDDPVTNNGSAKDDNRPNSNDKKKDKDKDTAKDKKKYSCMIVTHFYRRDLFTKSEWLINKKDALSGRLSENTIGGYHVWAPYAVLAMRDNPWLEKAFFNLFMARTRVIAFEQGRTKSASLKDKAARLLLEAPSILLGALGFKPDHNYNYDRIYGTYQDVALIYNKFYVKQPQGMIGW